MGAFKNVLYFPILPFLIMMSVIIQLVCHDLRTLLQEETNISNQSDFGLWGYSHAGANTGSGDVPWLELAASPAL